MSEITLTHTMRQTLAEGPGPWGAVSRGLRDALLAHARRTCRYWAEVAPEGIAFERVPPLTKQIVRERWDDLQARGVPTERRMESVTSGSSGEPARYVQDRASLGGEVAAMAALRALHGIPDEATVWFGISSPDRKSPPGWARFSLHDISAPAVEGMVAGWDASPAFWIYVRGSAVERIAERMRELGLRPARPPIAVVTSQDALSAPGRRRVAEAFGCSVHSWYGSQETSPFLGGTTPEGGYALNPLLAYVEIVDEEGLPVRVGERGRVLVTHLHNRVCPVIRCDLQDLAVRGDGHVGAWPVLERLDGRAGELLRLPSGRAIDAPTFGHQLIGVGELEPRILRYQCLQRGANTLELRVVWHGDPTPADAAAAAAAIRPLTDPDTVIDVVAVEDLETLPSGKRWILRAEPEADAAAVPMGAPGAAGTG